MLTTSDLLRLTYTPDLTEGGIAYACRSLASTYDRMGSSPFDHLRRSVAGVAVELIFRRYLSGQAVPFHIFGTTPFTHPDLYDVSLGGHRCIIESYLISHRSQITQLLQDPGRLLQAPALVQVDQFTVEGHKPDDLYLFAFILGVVAATHEDVDKAILAGQPVYLIHLLPRAWTRPGNWIPLENLALKSELGRPVKVEIGGQDARRDFITASLELPPRQRVLVEKGFHSLAYIHAQPRPEGRIGIYSLLRGEPYLIPTYAWGNLWVYGMEILFTGWLTHEEFRRKAKVLNVGAHTFQFERTHVKHLLVPVGELNPFGRLLDKVRAWEMEKSRSNSSF